MNQDLSFMGNQFDEIVEIIDNARTRAMRAVNAELINMYWEIGAYISQKVEADGWGKSVVIEFSEFLRHRYPASKGFSSQNIWRMKQFYETYRGNEKLSPLVREISWTNNLLILTGCKTNEAREFYLRLCAANNYSKRELDRQINSMLFERTMLSDTKNKELLTRSKGLVALAVVHHICSEVSCFGAFFTAQKQNIEHFSETPEELHMQTRPYWKNPNVCKYWKWC